MVFAILALAAAAEYRALGTEPFWALVISEKGMRLEEPGRRLRIFRTPPAKAGWNGYRRISKAVTVDVTHVPCSDGMSDRRYPDTVMVFIGDRTLNGCGGLSPDAPER